MIARPPLAAASLLATWLAATAAAGAGTLPAVSPQDENDLREFRIGLRVDELPKAGYRDFTCAAEPGRKLAGWQDFASCPKDASGFHALGFRYDESANPLSKANSLYEGTKVAGHPVLLTLLVGDDARVGGLVIETDPSAPLYLRKKAFLFAEQIKSRWGEQGWTCTEGQPGGAEEPVGGLFFKERCEKQTPTRRLVFDRTLYRPSGEDAKHFVSRTRLEILGNPTQQDGHG